MRVNHQQTTVEDRKRGKRALGGSKLLVYIYILTHHLRDDPVAAPNPRLWQSHSLALDVHLGDKMRNGRIIASQLVAFFTRRACISRL